MGTLAAFAAELAARSDTGLLRLLLLRPDAMTPPVPDFAALAARLSMRASIELALDRLNVPQLQTLSALHTGTQSALHDPFLTGLHELALVLEGSPKQKQLEHDAGTHHFLPLASVAPALGSKFAAEVPLRVLPPPSESVPVPARMRDNASAGAIDSLLRGMAILLDVVSTTGVDSLRGGAVGLRTLRMLAKSTFMDEAQLCFYLELAAAAGLLTLDSTAQLWRVTETDESAADRSGRWIVLVQAWLHNDRQAMPTAQAPSITRPLAPAAPHRQGATWRHNVVSALALLNSQAAAATSTSTSTFAAPTEASLLSLLIWLHPRQSEQMALQLPGILAELELMGVTGAGALSNAGFAAANADWDAAAACVGGLLPAPIEHFLIQGDLTAVAPGFLAPTVAAQLKLMATPEGHGTAGIYRFSQGSLENAVRAGLDEHAILNFLQLHCSTAVPQSLRYFITAATSAGVTEPPQPSITPQPRAGAISAEFVRTGTERAETMRPETALDEVQAHIAKLRSRPIWADAGGGESGPALVIEALRGAMAQGAQVRLHAVDTTGTIERIVLRPVSFEAGTLRARLPDTGQERRFSIHRIVAAEPVQDKQQDKQEGPHG
ncbi:helicase-associated domain-containing protein [Arthrobacter sp. E3]|uniref:helicase-associated domain-containing protein n=1 Tax=Arthrobacter sp. E3 TaxID=517402 RepID=UPI001A94DD0A|nr:helicase-associated domain-containing protein [Arthrobacter sp. E3]